MKTVLLYRPNSDHDTMVQAYLRDFNLQTGKDMPTLDVDSPEGQQMCQLYDIMQYPAIVVTDDNGVVQNMWVGEPLPKFDEVSYYVNGSIPKV